MVTMTMEATDANGRESKGIRRRIGRSGRNVQSLGNDSSSNMVDSDSSLYSMESSEEENYITGNPDLEHTGMYDSRIEKFAEELSDDSDGEAEIRRRLLRWEIEQSRGFGTTSAEWDGLILLTFLAAMFILTALLWRHFVLEPGVFYRNPWLYEEANELVRSQYP